MVVNIDISKKIVRGELPSPRPYFPPMNLFGFTGRFAINYKFSKLIKILTRVEITDPTSGLRMVGKNVISLFAQDYPRDYPEPESVVAVIRRNMRVEEIPVVMKEREGGVSSISMKKSVYYMIKVTLAILIERIRKY